jgi:gamma-glutamyltranspeptidase / glutathione hydrolase / leukotriene-C4 hydrolase
MKREMVQLGGSAVDAAIAAALCNGLMNAHSAGIGGGHFMLIYLKEKQKAYAIDAREQAPLSAYRDMFVNNSEASLLGGLATGIPGELAGFWEAHQLGGRLPWKKLFEPAIRMCTEGFRVSKALAAAIKSNEAHIRRNQPLSVVFIDPVTNLTKKENDTVKMPKLARTLTIVSEDNITAFYNNGLLTGLMMKEINDNGGNVTTADFANYRAHLRQPISVELNKDYRIYTLPPPSSGLLVSFIVRLMNGTLFISFHFSFLYFLPLFPKNYSITIHLFTY